MWALVQVLPIKHNEFLSDCYELKIVQRHSLQRTGIAAGGIFYNVQPGTAAQ